VSYIVSSVPPDISLANPLAYRVLSLQVYALLALRRRSLNTTLVVILIRLNQPGLRSLVTAETHGERPVPADSSNTRRPESAGTRWQAF
jgi:hypothetical protein